MRDDLRPSPCRIFETLVGYWNTEALKAAIELDLFTALGTSSRTAGELAERCRANEAGIRRLCDFLAALGLVRSRSGRYRSAPAAARYLDRQSAASLVSIMGFYMSPPVTEAFAHLAAAVRCGAAVLENERLLGPGSPAWVQFAEAVWPLRRIEANIVADTLDELGLARGRVLDLGCGGSPLGIALAERHRKLRVVAQDWPDVVAVAARHARRTGVADRVATLPGDARTIDLAGPYDLVLMVNFLEYFDPTTRLALSRKVYAALRPGGVAATYAPLREARGTSSWPAAAYSLLLLLTSLAGDAFTFAQLDELFQAAGFAASHCCEGLPLVLARKPKLARRARTRQINRASRSGR
jgi:SAM-dependent methyltransferase